MNRYRLDSLERVLADLSRDEYAWLPANRRRALEMLYRDNARRLIELDRGNPNTREERDDAD